MDVCGIHKSRHFAINKHVFFHLTILRWPVKFSFVIIQQNTFVHLLRSALNEG